MPDRDNTHRPRATQLAASFFSLRSHLCSCLDQKKVRTLLLCVCFFWLMPVRNVSCLCERPEPLAEAVEACRQGARTAVSLLQPAQSTVSQLSLRLSVYRLVKGLEIISRCNLLCCICQPAEHLLQLGVYKQLTAEREAPSLFLKSDITVCIIICVTLGQAGLRRCSFNSTWR